MGGAEAVMNCKRALERGLHFRVALRSRRLTETGQTRKSPADPGSPVRTVRDSKTTRVYAVRPQAHRTRRAGGPGPMPDGDRHRGAVAIEAPRARSPRTREEARPRQIHEPFAEAGSNDEGFEIASADQVPPGAERHESFRGQQTARRAPTRERPHPGGEFSETVPESPRASSQAKARGAVESTSKR